MGLSDGEIISTTVVAVFTHAAYDGRTDVRNCHINDARYIY